MEKWNPSLYIQYPAFAYLKDNVYNFYDHPDKCDTVNAGYMHEQVMAEMIWENLMFEYHNGE